MNTELVKLSEWFKINKLSLNVKKSNYMLFGKKITEVLPVILDGVELIRVNCTKFLGVIIDERFTWVNHIDAIKNKVRRTIGCMYRIRDKVDKLSLFMVYNTLVLPYLMYCCELWGNTYKIRINDLMLLQKRAIRLIENVSYRSHTSEIFKKYGILKIKDLIDLHTCLLMYKASNKQLPVNVQMKFTKNKDIHKFNTRSKNELHMQSVNSSLKYKSTNNRGVRIWNEIDHSIREITSFGKFE